MMGDMGTPVLRRRRILLGGLATGCLGLLSGCGIGLPGSLQPPRPRLVGNLANGTAENYAPSLAAFRQGMQELGYVDAPGVFFPTVAQLAPLLDAIRHPLLDDVLAGSVTGTIALAGASGAWVVNGDATKTFVAEADRVNWIAFVGTGPEVRLAAREAL